MLSLDYTIRTSVVLHTEHYSNAGLTREEMMNCVKDVKGVMSVDVFRINNNIELTLSVTTDEVVREVLMDVHETLQAELELKYDKNDT